MENCEVQRRSPYFAIMSRVQAAWKRLLKWQSQRRDYKQQMTHLGEMDDRQLKDIGLTRSDVDRLVGTKRSWDPQVDREQLLDPRMGRH